MLPCHEKNQLSMSMSRHATRLLQNGKCKSWQKIAIQNINKVLRESPPLIVGFSGFQ